MAFERFRRIPFCFTVPPILLISLFYGRVDSYCSPLFFFLFSYRLFRNRFVLMFRLMMKETVIVDIVSILLNMSKFENCTNLTLRFPYLSTNNVDVVRTPWNWMGNWSLYISASYAGTIHYSFLCFLRPLVSVGLPFLVSIYRHAFTVYNVALPLFLYVSIYNHAVILYNFITRKLLENIRKLQYLIL